MYISWERFFKWQELETNPLVYLSNKICSIQQDCKYFSIMCNNVHCYYLFLTYWTVTS